MEKRVVDICVYRDTVDGSAFDTKGQWRFLNEDGSDDFNLCYIKLAYEDCARYFVERQMNEYESDQNSTEPLFEQWLGDYDAEWTEDLYEWIQKNKVEYEIKRTSAKTLPLIAKATPFIDDEEKMIDLFTMKKDEFLKFYSYLTEEEYNATIDAIVEKSGYWHKEWREDNDYDGTVLKDIILGLMITDWLRKRGN